jgi:uncharacterized protein YjiS (DUF1127 family)
MSLYNNDALHLSQSRQRIPSAPGMWLAQLQTAFQRVRTAWLIRRRRQRDAQMLHAFSDREFWDVGLSRSDISSIVRGTYRRD